MKYKVIAEDKVDFNGTVFKVGDYVYASDWCFGQIVDLHSAGAYVEFETEFGGGTFFFEYDEMKPANERRNYMRNFGLKYEFDSRYSAEEALVELVEIANRYGYVTTEDFAWLVGERAPYFGYIYGLTKSEMDEAYIDRTRGGYIIVTPLVHPCGESGEDTPTKETNEEDESSAEPVNITIHTNELESPGTYISDIFRQVSNIKDRIVNITIMP